MAYVKPDTLPWYVADFETTSIKDLENFGKTKVWLFSICDSNCNIIKNGYSIEEFMDYIEDNLCGSLIYFHNLKFDGSFILDYLFNNGYEWKEDVFLNDSHKFTTLIDDTKVWYQMKINFKQKKQILIYDSLKLLPMSEKKLAEKFGLPIQKGKIDYSDYTINDETIEYVNNDVKIVCLGLQALKRKGIGKMTIAGSAYANYMDMYPNAKKMFTQLPREFLLKWRSAYRGGRSQLNPRFKGKIINNVNRFDVNSMYPSIMRNAQLPYGEPIYTNEIGKYEFELYDINVEFELKEGHLPSLLKKQSKFANDDTYYVNSDGIENILISSIDFKLLERNYDIYYLEFNEIVGFKTNNFMFRKYVDYWYDLKSKEKGADKQVDKLMLNSLYGKFGSNIVGQHAIPRYDKGKICYELSEEEERKAFYLPIAIAITSYGHKLLDDEINVTGIENFVYCDTDSIHTIGTISKDMIDNVILGKFKLEGVEDVSRYIKSKTYIYKAGDKYSITCAGMPDSVKEEFLKMYGDNCINEFKVGLEIGGKLRPKIVNGGTVFDETTFRIKP